jgi:hypothetical protein
MYIKRTHLLLALGLLGLLFHPEVGGSIFLRNLTEFLPDYTALHPERQYTSHTVLTVMKKNLEWPGKRGRM